MNIKQFPALRGDVYASVCERVREYATACIESDENKTWTYANVYIVYCRNAGKLNLNI